MRIRRTTLGVIAVLCTACAHRARSMPSSDTASSVQGEEGRHPATVAEAVSQSLGKMSDAEKHRIRTMKRDDVPHLLHGFQMTARYEFGLARGNVPLLRSCGSETMVLEDCLLVILDAIWLQLQR